MSWKPEVQTVGDGDHWAGNALRFATREEAEKNAQDLMFRWTAVTNIRAVESDDPVNYRWNDEHGLVEVKETSLKVGDLVYVDRQARIRQARVRRVMKVNAEVAYTLKDGRVLVKKVRIADCAHETAALRSSVNIAPYPAPQS